MSGLTVFFPGFVFKFELDSCFLYSEVVIVRIDEVCSGVEELYGL